MRSAIQTFLPLPRIAIQTNGIRVNNWKNDDACHLSWHVLLLLLTCQWKQDRSTDDMREERGPDADPAP
jgi:hypothetical protein